MVGFWHLISLQGHLARVNQLAQKATQSTEFFVVGGPVQPDRDCYVQRAADDRLWATIAEQKFAFVLSPRATGKSSLMARTIRQLRNEGQLAAVVDLTQIGARGESADAARWYYGIAYRVVRELRLKIDLQAWWQDKSPLLNEQRLVEFFWDVVLTNTSAPVTIFFDEAERAADLPFSTELFAALRNCYMRRVSEPDYTRLNFVVLGVATPEQLCADPSVSPFTEGRAIVLDDFTAEECAALAPGLGQNEELSRALLDRMHSWTRGHPYLTQKVARGVMRKGAKLGSVDQVVKELLLAPGVSQEEPLLSHIRSLLVKPGAGARQAAMLLSRLGKGQDVIYDPASPAQIKLALAGLVSVDENGMLRYRNRIFEQVFDFRWARSAVPLGWQRPLIAAAALALVVLPPYWYFELLPRPYINTLTVVSQDIGLAEEAYDRLRRLPGFGSRARELLSAAMLRRAAGTMAIEEVLEADAVLRSLPDREEMAEQMLADFWLRQSTAAMQTGNRDAALIYATAALDGRPEAATTAAAELIGSDYGQLEQSYRLTVPALAWEVDWERNQIVVVDETHEVQHLSLVPESGIGAAGAPARIRRVPGRLSAVQHVAVSRMLSVDADGPAGAFNLLLTVQHGRASDLLLRLRAPSGAVTEFAVPQPRAAQQLLIFSARPRSALAVLAEESVRGEWELTLFDRRSGDEGSLMSWGLQFAGTDRVWNDAPEQGIALPDPARTEQVRVVLAADGRTAVAAPAREGVAGAISVWDLERGERSMDLQIETQPLHVSLLAEPGRVLAVFPNSATLWSTDRQDALAVIESGDGFLPRAAVGPDERYFALAESVRSGAQLRVFSAEDGNRLGVVELNSLPLDFVLAADAEQLAVVDGSRRGQILDPRSGRLVREFLHQRELQRLVAVGHQGTVIAVDIVGDLFAWPLNGPDGTLTASDGIYLGTTSDPSSVAMAASADRISFMTAKGSAAVRSILGVSRAEDLSHGRGEGQSQTRLGAAADLLVSSNGSFLRLWRLENSDGGRGGQSTVSAVALDDLGTIAALGFRGGYVRSEAWSEWRVGSAARGARVDYIGHRGAVTSVAVNAERNVIVSGGSDSLVRIWDLQSVSPNEYFLRHPSGAVVSLAMSRDGRWVASGGDFSARVWQLQTGQLSTEIPVDGRALAVAFSPAGELVAVGDSAGNIFLGAPSGAVPLRSARAAAAVTALRFSEDSALLASGDQDGNLVLWDVLAAETAEGSFQFPEPIEWIAFGPEANQLYVQSGPWVHALEQTPTGLAMRATRLLPTRLSGDIVLAAAADGSIHGLGGSGAAEIAPLEFRLDEPMSTPLVPDSPLLRRDWSRILELTLDRSTAAVRVTRR